MIWFVRFRLIMLMLPLMILVIVVFVLIVVSNWSQELRRLYLEERRAEWSKVEGA